MIITIEDLKTKVDCGDMRDEVILSRLKAIEDVIRKYTNNNFQNRAVRFGAVSEGDTLLGNPLFFRVGDTVQISQSEVNDGLYTVVAVEADRLVIDGDLFSTPYNLVTKVEYPDGVVQIATDLFEWQKDYGNKIGVKSKSETLSRHSTSVTYEDSATLFMGYPVGVLSGLSLYRKARF